MHERGFNATAPAQTSARAVEKEQQIMTRLPTLIAVLCVAGWMMPDVSGQQSQQRKQRQQQRSEQRQQQSRQKQAKQQSQDQKRVATVTGKLQDVRTVNLKGEGRHVLAKLQTRSGKTIVVDLGRPQDLIGRKFRRGQELSALGRPGRINGKPLIVADKLRDPSQREPTLTIVRIVPLPPMALAQGQPGEAQQAGDRRQMQQRRQQQQKMQQQRKQKAQQQASSARHVISGKLLGTREFTLKGESDKHVLARIETPQGRKVLVDLGTREGLQDVKLTSGELIATTGQFGRINGRPVLFADHIADLVSINRDESQAQQAGARQRGESAGQSQPPSSSDNQQKQSEPQKQRQEQSDRSSGSS